MAAVLVIEDDEVIGDLLTSALNANGYDVAWHTTGQAGIQVAQARPFDLVLLDLGLPDMDGVDVCRHLRRLQPRSVIVALTAKRDVMDVVEGLESGADDYLTKPFRMTELLARIRAHLRRGGTGHAGSNVIELGDLRIEPEARRCRIHDVEVSLRPKEFELLARLAAQPNVAVTRETLLDDVWDQNWYGSTKTLDVHIAALRHRLAEASGHFTPAATVPTITTLRSHGYRLDVPPPANDR